MIHLHKEEVEFIVNLSRLTLVDPLNLLSQQPTVIRSLHSLSPSRSTSSPSSSSPPSSHHHHRRKRPSLATPQALPRIHAKREFDNTAAGYLPASTATGATREEILASAGTSGCMLSPMDCLMRSKALSNPLMTIALESGAFSYEGLDFLNLCLQWNPEHRPSAEELLEHPFVSSVAYNPDAFRTSNSDSMWPLFA
ncbi:hypothetical protein BC829DRAFT_268348 [Chytridium lagenaria]|nr:hypothetical protein BC829DRAFT_268348 [Chytridium lagenaria]